MLPQGRLLPLTGAPSWARHACAPVPASKAYTELASVAAITWPPTTRGWPYTSPSSFGVSQTLWTCPMGAWSAATPVRAASWWYVVQAPEGAVAAVVAVVGAGPCTVGLSDFDGDDEQPARISAAASAPPTNLSKSRIPCRKRERRERSRGLGE